MKKRSLTALVLIFAMAMANPGLNNAAERSIPEKEKTENAGNKRETPATPSDLESKGNSGDASEKKTEHCFFSHSSKVRSCYRSV